MKILLIAGYCGGDALAGVFCYGFDLVRADCGYSFGFRSAYVPGNLLTD